MIYITANHDVVTQNQDARTNSTVSLKGGNTGIQSDEERDLICNVKNSKESKARMVMWTKDTQLSAKYAHIHIINPIQSRAWEYFEFRV